MEVVETENFDIFVGLSKDYERAKRENKINVNPDDVDEEEKNKPPIEVKIDDLSIANLQKLDDETFKILKRTRTVNEYDVVYMQHRLDFYDDYYNNSSVAEELKAAKQLRRIYRDYREYLNAIEIRNAYIDYLVDQYGGENEFLRKMDLGLVTDWIPPYPILSKKCPDYDLFQAGLLPTDNIEPDDEAIESYIQSMQERMEHCEVEFRYGVEDKIGDIKRYKEIVDEEVRKYTGGSRKNSAVTNGDLESLRGIFRSWYKPDSTNSSTHELFYNAPENIRKRFIEEKEINEPGLLSDYVNGKRTTEEDDRPGPNDMVYDQDLNKPIPYKEWVIREDVRLFEKAGWSKAKLLNYRNVGSALERTARKTQPSRKRTRHDEYDPFDDKDLFNEIIYGSSDGIESTYTENEYILGNLESLMRGGD